MAMKESSLQKKNERTLNSNFIVLVNTINISNMLIGSCLIYAVNGER